MTYETLQLLAAIMKFVYLRSWLLTLKFLYLDILVDKVSFCFLLLDLFYLGEFIYIIFSLPQSRHTLKFLKNFLFQFAISLPLFRDSLVAQRVKNLTQGSIPGSGRSLEEGNKNSLQYSCLENPMDGRAWWTTVHKSQTRLSNFTFALPLFYPNH